MTTNKQNGKSQPVQIYVILFLTTAFFFVEVVAWYITHGLTLQINAYHMLCNIVALIGCITSHKFAQRQITTVKCPENEENIPLTVNIEGDTVPNVIAKELKPEKRMKNTFGWARIDVLAILIGCVTLTSFCFSTVVSAAQTLVHINHLHEMHFPLPVICIGSTGLVLNLFCNYLIGGYTYSQGVFLKSRRDGYVALQSKNSEENEDETIEQPKRQEHIDIWRDVLGCMIIIISASFIYFTDKRVAKFIDPIFAIVSAVSLFLLSCPYIMDSALILLQTIPNHINIHYLQKELLQTFPQIVNVHDLHVWQLNGERIICTVHIIFQHQSVISSLTGQITEFLKDVGITQVTIQPELHKLESGDNLSECLIRCRSQYCLKSQCCPIDDGLATKELSKKSLKKSQSSGSVDDAEVTQRAEIMNSQLISIETTVLESSNDVDSNNQELAESYKFEESVNPKMFNMDDDTSFLSIDASEKSVIDVFGSGTSS